MTKVTDERLGRFTRFQHDILQRVLKGSLDPDDVEGVIRPLIGQDKSNPLLVETNLELSDTEGRKLKQYSLMRSAKAIEILQWLANGRALKILSMTSLERREDDRDTMRSYMTKNKDLFIPNKSYLFLLMCKDDFCLVSVDISDMYVMDFNSVSLEEICHGQNTLAGDFMAWRIVIPESSR